MKPLKKSVNPVALSLADAAVGFAKERVEYAETHLRRAGYAEPHFKLMRARVAVRSLKSAQNQINAALALLDPNCLEDS